MARRPPPHCRPGRTPSRLKTGRDSRRPARHSVFCDAGSPETCRASGKRPSAPRSIRRHKGLRRRRAHARCGAEACAGCFVFDAELDGRRPAGTLFEPDRQGRIVPGGTDRERRGAERRHRERQTGRQDRRMTHQQAVTAGIQGRGRIRRLAAMGHGTVHRAVHACGHADGRGEGHGPGNRRREQSQAQREEGQPCRNTALGASVEQRIPGEAKSGPWSRHDATPRREASTADRHRLGPSMGLSRTRGLGSFPTIR